MTSILQTMTPTTAKAVESTAEYLETLYDMSKMPLNAHPHWRALVRRRYDEVRAFTLNACATAGFASLPMDLAKAVVREKREHRAFHAKRRADRRREREVLLAARAEA